MRECRAAKTKSNRSADAGRRRFCQTACVSGFAAAGGLATFVLAAPQWAQGATMGRNADTSDAELPGRLRHKKGMIRTSNVSQTLSRAITFCSIRESLMALGTLARGA